MVLGKIYQNEASFCIKQEQISAVGSEKSASFNGKTSSFVPVLNKNLF